MGLQILYFVHGTTTDNELDRCTGWLPGELSELGKQQARSLGEQVAHQQFDIVFCSDLQRAVDSAELGFAQKYQIIQDKRLRECNYGAFNGGFEDDFKKEAYIYEPFPDGESYLDVEKRMRLFIKMLSQDYGGKRVAIVAHQAPQLALEVIVNGKTWERAFAEDWRKKKAWQPGWKYELS